MDRLTRRPTLNGTCFKQSVWSAQPHWAEFKVSGGRPRSRLKCNRTLVYNETPGQPAIERVLHGGQSVSSWRKGNVSQMVTSFKPPTVFTVVCSVSLRGCRTHRGVEQAGGHPGRAARRPSARRAERKSGGEVPGKRKEKPRGRSLWKELHSERKLERCRGSFRSPLSFIPQMSDNRHYVGGRWGACL